MAGGGDLTAFPLRPQASFNWIYLVELITGGILALFFLFYFNRVFATLLSYTIRLYTWHKLRIYISIEALQFSPIAGRIFFKGIRYHGENQTIFVHGGYITWRYWFRKVRECEILSAKEDKDSTRNPSVGQEQSLGEDADGEAKARSSTSKLLPCRISVKITGLEAFVYNRSPVYDAIVKGVQEKNLEDQTMASHGRSTIYGEKASKDGLRARTASSAPTSPSLESNPETLDRRSSTPEIVENGPKRGNYNAAGMLNLLSPTESEPPPEVSSPNLPAFLQLLPIQLKCTKGAVVLGNENTRSIITANFATAEGQFDAGACGAYDIFKILMNFKILKPVIQMKPNVDFKKTQMAEAQNLKANVIPDGGEKRQERNGLRSMQKFFRSVFWLDLLRRTVKRKLSFDSIAKQSKEYAELDSFYKSPSGLPGHGRWQGLSRYLNDSQHDEHAEWDAVEYARSSTLADCNSIDFKFYWDIPGLVPRHPGAKELPKRSIDSDINGDVPPEYGMELAVHGGVLNYGPWADRLRVGLQEIYFPFSFHDYTPAAVLKPGEARVSTVFKLFLSIEEDTTVRIPFREASKDHKWKGRASNIAGNGNSTDEPPEHGTKSHKMPHKLGHRKKKVARGDLRPFAWFDIRVSPKSTVTYNMDMVASPRGYKNLLSVDLRGLDIFSSLNHGLLWQSQRVQMACDLSYPLEWNGLRQWHFDISISRLDFFLLRDHTFQLMDLINDWTSGPPAEFFTFTPYRYKLDVHFHDFKLFLNTNDANIINNHANLDDNNFVILYGESLNADLMIPLDHLRPTENEISFHVNSTNLGFELSLPPKNTANAFLRNKNVANLKDLHLDGSYTYCSEVAPGLTETLFLDVVGNELTIQFYGFFARQLGRVKDNYFGDDLHFRTFEEYQALLRNLSDPKQTPAIVPDVPITKSNDLDVILNITANNPIVIIPSNLYASEEHIRLQIKKADVDLRVSNYFLELMVNSSPLELGHTSLSSGIPADITSTNTEIFIDGLKVYGHRLFGLPPAEPTYVSNWDIEAGRLIGECSSSFLRKAIGAAEAISLSIMDVDNSMPLSHIPIVHDMTFVRFQCPLIRLWFHAGQAAFLFQTDGIQGDFNDRGQDRFSERLKMSVPGVILACIDKNSASPQRDTTNELVKTHAALKTNLTLTMIQRGDNFSKNRDLQREHVEYHDQRTNRATFLVEKNLKSPERVECEIPSMPLPYLPEPARSSNPMNAPGSYLKTSRNHMAHESRPPISSSLHSTAYGKEFVSSKNVNFSSSLLTPYFPLNSYEPDLSDLPPIKSQYRKRASSYSSSAESTVFHVVEENGLHTSIMLRAEPGVTVFCKPQAVDAVVDLMHFLMPSNPGEIMDYFHVSVMKEILIILNAIPGRSNLLDLNVRLPVVHARLINHFEVEAEGQTLRQADQYDVIIHDTTLLTRIKNVSTNEGARESLSVHVTAKSISASVEEGLTNSKRNDAAFRATISDVLLWVADEGTKLIHTSFQEAETLMESDQIDYLALLIHRTAMLVQTVQANVMKIIPERQKNLRLFIYKLNLLAGNTMAPPFLANASNTFRAPNDRLRSTNSWRIISRLQYLFQNLSMDEKAQLVANDYVPDDAEPSVLANLDQWRVWDSRPIEDSIAVRMLYGSMPGVRKLHEQRSVPLGVSFRGSILKAIVDPGQKQTELIVDAIAINITVEPPTALSGLMLVEESIEETLTVIQISSSSIGVSLKWEICQLLEKILTLFEQDSLTKASDELITTQHSIPKMQPKPDRIQIVFGTDKGFIDLQTINLHQKILAEGLKASITGCGWSKEYQNTSVNFLLHASGSSSELSSHGRSIWSTKIVSPSLWLSYKLSTVHNESRDSWQIAGDSDDISLCIRDELIGLVEVINSVIDEEALYLHRLVQRHMKLQTSDQNLSVTPKLTTVELALFLNAYKIELAIITGLSYCTLGKSVRLSVTPGQLENSQLTIDFDLKAQKHQTLNETKVLSTLVMPPINGTMQLHLGEAQTIVSALATVESISLEGKAVYVLLSTLSSPRLSNALTAITEDVKVVILKAKEAFQLQEIADPPTNPTSSKAILYDVRFVLAGLSVSADAPSTLQNAASSNILFELGSAYLKGTNKSIEDGSVLPLPSVRASFRQSSITVRRIAGKNVRKYGRMDVGIALNTAVTGTKDGINHMRVQMDTVGPEIIVFADTAPIILEILGHFQQRLAKLTFLTENVHFRRLRKLDTIILPPEADVDPIPAEDAAADQLALLGLDISLSLDIKRLQLTWSIKDSVANPVARHPENLELSLKRLQLLTRSEKDARLSIQELMLQIVPVNAEKGARSPNSALLPNVNFNVAHRKTKADRQLVLYATGRALYLQLDPHFILPANDIERSINSSLRKIHTASENLIASATATNTVRQPLFGKRRLTSLLVDADFAGAVVQLQGKRKEDLRRGTIASLNLDRLPQHGKYGQFAMEGSANNAVLRAPGIALKVQYQDTGDIDPALNVELRIDGSNNVLEPAVVPLVMQILESVKQAVREPVAVNSEKKTSEATKAPTKFIDEESLVAADPKNVLGKVKLNVGLRICKQEFGLSCQPIAKVDAIARLEDIYIMINSVESTEKGNFFAASATIKGLSASLKHVYSRDATFSFDIDSIVMSLMNSKRHSGISGISAILKINPAQTQVNVKQLQDILIFKEIWIPEEIRHASKESEPSQVEEAQEYFVQRYQQVAASTPFHWNATIEIAKLSINLDLGQSIGKTSLQVMNLWAASKKSSTTHQNLCIGVDDVIINSSGRMSGFVELQKAKVRTFITWPSEAETDHKTPLIQISLGFDSLRTKAAFDYVTFAILHVTSFEFIMYNVRDPGRSGDRLVAILDGDNINAYCLASSASLGLALFQAFGRLAQEKDAAYEQSLKELDKFTRRKMSVIRVRPSRKVRRMTSAANANTKFPISLHTDVVVNLRSMDIGAFPNSLFDRQILRVETADVQARFAVALESGKIHSGLGLTLGQLRVSLAAASRPNTVKPLGEITVEEIVSNAKSARGGVILRVPKVLAAMQTWQASNSNTIDYIFKSSFEGKIDVGWNYSRISYIRGMWTTHTRTLASRLGKPLPEAAVKITGAPEPHLGDRVDEKLPVPPEESQKITAVVNLPQSKYTYRALEPAVIVTPQLRDMGEATPPLEWIGLHRDKLPNLTHQIIIVSLLEIAKEVEDAYSSVLGA